MKSTEFLKENQDWSEYNDEAGMVDSNLETIKRAAEELDQALRGDENMAEWAQEKIAVVKSMIVTVKDYVISQKDKGEMPSVAECTTAGSVATVATPLFKKTIKRKRK